MVITDQAFRSSWDFYLYVWPLGIHRYIYLPVQRWVGLGHDQDDEGRPSGERPRALPLPFVLLVVVLPEEPGLLVIPHDVPVNVGRQVSTAMRPLERLKFSQVSFSW